MNLRAAMHERTPMVILSGEVAAYGENREAPDPGRQWLHDLTDFGGSPECVNAAGSKFVKHEIGSAAVIHVT